MNKRSLVLHSLVLLGLLLAALALQRDDYERRAAAPGETLVDAKPGQASQVTWRRGDYALTVLSRSDGGGRYFIGEVQAGPAAAPARFRAGAAAERLFQSLEPLKAIRVIEGADDQKLAELGLAGDDGASLELMIQGALRRFQVGSGVFGKSDHYARDDQGRVVVLPGSLIAPLDRGRSALTEARLITSGRRAMQTLSITVDGRELVAEQHGMGRPGQAFWARGGDKTGDDALTAWVGQLLTLTARDWSERKLTGATPALTATIKSTAGLEVWRLFVEQDDSGETYSVVSSHGRLTADVDPQAARALLEAARRVTEPREPPAPRVPRAVETPSSPSVPDATSSAGSATPKLGRPDVTAPSASAGPDGAGPAENRPDTPVAPGDDTD